MGEPLRLSGKRVVLVFGSFDLGGAERQGLHLATALRDKHGAEVLIFSLTAQPGRLSQLCDEKGIHRQGVNFSWGKTGLTRTVNLFGLARTLKAARPDVILSYTAVPNLACGIIWKYTGAKLFIWNQRDEGLLLNKKIWHRRAVASTLFFLANSANGKKFLQDNYQVGSSMVAVIHNGVEPSTPVMTREEWRSRLDISIHDFVGCMVANIHPFKDHATLLRAWALVFAGMGAKGNAPLLLLAGRDDAGGDKLRQLAEELGIAPHVRFLGKVDDVAGLLKAVDVCLHSSKSEGLPNAVLEAMAAGCPVIATDIPGVREAVGEELEDCLVPAGDAEALSQHIQKFLPDARVRLEIGQRLRERVEREFNLQSMCERTACYIAQNLPHD